MLEIGVDPQLKGRNPTSGCKERCRQPLHLGLNNIYENHLNLRIHDHFPYHIFNMAITSVYSFRQTHVVVKQWTFLQMFNDF